jgi:putative molybdopterin biosynthesis protein
MSAPTNRHDQMLTTKQVATLLNCTPQTIQDLIKRGELPAIRLGRQFRIEPAELRRYIETHRTRPPEGAGAS